MHTLIDHIQEQPPSAVQILTNTRVLELLHDARTGRVKGARCRSGDGSVGGDRAVEADAVILATGGYSADRTGLLKEFVPGEGAKRLSSDGIKSKKLSILAG